MLKLLSPRNLLGQLKNSNKLCKRLFLSDAFKCTEAWENRLKAPIFRRLDFGAMYANLDSVISSGRSINVLDIDLFVNGIVDDSYQHQLEDLLVRLRTNPETSIMYESTSHAAIRWFLANNKKNELLNALSQRLIYGLFPDIYLNILMIDTFLKQKDSLSGVKIAVLQMLQDDCNHPILRTLSLYSCIKHLNSSEVWVKRNEEETAKDDDEEEIIKVRVKFVRNEYFDDHFDIIEPYHLIGKTMLQFGKTVEEPVGISSQLIGLVLYEKFDEAKKLLSDVLKNDVPLYKEAVEKAKSYLEENPNQKATADDKGSGSKSVEEEIAPVKMDVLKLLDELGKKNLLSESLETVLEKCVKVEVDAYEKEFIEKQCEKYKTWEKERLENIEKEIKEREKRLVLEEIEEMKKQMEEEERKLFYFDNENEYDMIIERNREEKANIKPFKPIKSKNKYAEAHGPHQETKSTQ